MGTGSVGIDSGGDRRPVRGNYSWGPTRSSDGKAKIIEVERRGKWLSRRNALAAGGTAALALARLIGCTAVGALNGISRLAPNGDSAKLAASAVPFGPQTRLKLDVWVPKTRTPGAALPVVVFFYGGGWVAGERRDYGFAGRAFAARGFVAIVPDYRLVPGVRFPTFIEDGALAVKWAAGHAAKYGGDPARITLAGHSAGSYIGAMLALDRRYLAKAGVDPDVVRAAAFLSGPYDFYPYGAARQDAPWALGRGERETKDIRRTERCERSCHAGTAPPTRCPPYNSEHPLPRWQGLSKVRAQPLFGQILNPHFRHCRAFPPSNPALPKCRILYKPADALTACKPRTRYTCSAGAVFGRFAGGPPSWVQKDGPHVIAGDGQVSLGNTVIKPNAKKVRRLGADGSDGKGSVIGGFAGATADAFTLFERLEKKLEQYNGQLMRAAVELAKDWRTDKYLRQLEAMMIVADAEVMLILTGNGDVLEPEGGIAAIGSGGNYALAAAKALAEYEADPEVLARRAMQIASEVCVFTNDRLTVETVEAAA